MNIAAKQEIIPPTFFIIARQDDGPFFMHSGDDENIFELGVDKVRVRKILVTDRFLQVGSLSRTSRVKRPVASPSGLPFWNALTRKIIMMYN